MDLSFPIEKVKPAIVQIIYQESVVEVTMGRPFPKPSPPIILGTGFFVNEQGYIITARHVIELGREFLRKSQADLKNIYIGLGLPNTLTFRGNFYIFHCDIIDEDSDNDLCLLQTKRNPFTKERKSTIKTKEMEISYLIGTVKINPNRPVDGASIGISGYPFEYSVLISNSGVVATSWDFVSKEIQSGEVGWPPILDRYLGDVEVNPGNSGGPVYLTEDASVIGVCVSYKGSNIWGENGRPAIILGHQLFYSSGLTTIIPSKYILELLEKNGIST